VRMPEMDGIETAQRIRHTRGRPVVVLMSSDETADLRGCAAAAFLPKKRLKAAVLRELWERYAPLG
jgi:CheY-like chemotaxis protein